MGTELSLAAQAAVLKTLLDAVRGVYDKVRADADAALWAAHTAGKTTRQEICLPGSEIPVAALGMSVPKPDTFRVDQDALLAWCQQRHPDEVTERVVVAAVRPAFVTALLARLKVDGDVVVDSETGEVIGWATVVPGGGRTLSLTFTKAGKAAVVAAYRDGALTLPQVLALPARTATPAGEARDDG